MKVIGSRMLGMDEHLKDTPMGTLTMEDFKMGKLMAKVCIHGITVRFMMESGTKASSMDMVSGEDCTGTLTLENGAIQKLKVTGFTLGRTEIDTKESGNNA